MKPFCPFPLLIFIFFVFIFQARAEPSDTQIVAQPIVSKENVVISAPLKDGVAAMDSIGVVNPPLKDNKDSFRPIPFSAKYKITLDKSSHFDEGIDKVHGTLEMTIKETDKDDVCVWTTEQKSTLYIYYKGKSVADKYELMIASYESKNGQNYEFYVRSIVNDSQDEMIFKGEAKLPEGKQGYIQLKQNGVEEEESKIVTLPAGTLFPLRHMHMLIEEALKGNMTVGQKKVFDGSSDAQEVVEVDAYITPRNNYKMNVSTDSKTTDPAEIELAQRLKNAKAWQIKVNVFTLGSNDYSDPDYSYSQTVNSLGIPVSMKITHSDPEFTVDIVMTDFSKTPISNGSAFNKKPAEK
ncbi:MAG: DUF1849 family protein [Alphaproteobacteria bacterium]|nr:DUF1849 family protein [Alphaproteobacteria bacterium]